jgi:hypothetical protein
MEFGPHVRLRFWYLCLSGPTDSRCGLVTWSDDYGVWWEKGRKQCCGISCHANYKSSYGQIVQLEIRSVSYFLWMDVFTWWDNNVLDGLRQMVNKSEMTSVSARDHLQSFDKLQFNQVFTQATQEQVKNGVQLSKTFALTQEGSVLLRPGRAWAWMTLAGVIKNAMQ